MAVCDYQSKTNRRALVDGSAGLAWSSPQENCSSTRQKRALLPAVLRAFVR